jgi:hypothetical protein
MTINLEPDTGKDVSLVDFLVKLRQAMRDRIKDREDLIKSGKFEYSEVWVMSKEPFEKLPETPTYLDMVKGGGIFQGWKIER